MYLPPEPGFARMGSAVALALATALTAVSSEWKWLPSLPCKLSGTSRYAINSSSVRHGSGVVIHETRAFECIHFDRASSPAPK